LRNLSQNHGITILISSHLLPEIEKLVTHIGIINHGRLVFQGTLADLISKRQQSSYILFETNNDSAASLVINSFCSSSLIEAGRIAVPLLDKERVAAINRKLVQNNIEVYQITTVENDLEKIFFDVIGE
jgi:ABC-2 type transport system ATP-binding protein